MEATALGSNLRRRIQYTHFQSYLCVFAGVLI